MAELLIRPSTKLIKLWYWLSLVLIIAIVLFVRVNEAAQEKHGIWLLIVPGVLLVITVVRHLGVRFTRMTITGDSLRFETGVFGKSTRNIPVSKIQDVRVDQSMKQRMFGLGNLSIETAGGASHLTILNVDHPQSLAEQILALSRPERPTS